jgi:hypothetical protein
MPEACKPKIRISLNTARKTECETPTLGFVRLTLMPSDTELVESEEDPGQAAPSNRTP